MPRRRADRPAAKDRPLVDDIRFLGRILGDVIREQEGEAAYERVERVRRLAVASRLTADAERADHEAAVRARVTQLWQTRVLRDARLTVADEIENALSYYRATFLKEVPRLYRSIEAALPGQAIAPFFRMGNWIGGDRDGNPYVTAETLRAAFARQCETI